jgi:capsule polysaccharide modification protein KpsS
LSICEQIANVLPYGHILAVKEHPGHPGMIKHGRLKTVLRHHSNMVYLSADIRLCDILPYTSGIITINSSAGLEALANDIPVITIGECFYRGEGLTYDVMNPLRLQYTLTEAIGDPLKKERKKKLIHLLCEILQETVPEPTTAIDPQDNNNLNVIAYGIKVKIEKYL